MSERLTDERLRQIRQRAAIDAEHGYEFDRLVLFIVDELLARRAADPTEAQRLVEQLLCRAAKWIDTAGRSLGRCPESRLLDAALVLLDAHPAADETTDAELLRLAAHFGRLAQGE